MFSKEDVKDREFGLEKENNHLKEQSNILESEIHKMQTKLLRITQLVSKRNKSVNEIESYGDGGIDTYDMAHDLKQEFNDLSDQNAARKEKVRKLKVIWRGLSNKAFPGSNVGKYDHVQGKLNVNVNKSTKDYAIMVEDLRRKLVANNKLVLVLQTELNKQQETVPGGVGGIDKIKKQIFESLAEIRTLDAEQMDLENSFKNNTKLIEESKMYTLDVKKKIDEKRNELTDVENRNRQLEYNVMSVRHLEEELRGYKEDIEGHEKMIRNVSAEPFMRQENGVSIKSRIADKEARLLDCNREGQKLDGEDDSLKQEVATLTEAKNSLVSKNALLLTQQQEAVKDYNEKTGGGLNQDSVMTSLLEVDAHKYGQLLTDLHMPNGGQPLWAKLPFLETGIPAGSESAAEVNNRRGGDPKTVLEAQIARIKGEKAQFAAELEKAEELLKLQKDIERENTIYHEREKERLKFIEKSVATKLLDLSRAADEKQRKISQQEKLINQKNGIVDKHGNGLTGMKDADGFSEFSTMTNESDLNADENILDFKVQEASFDVAAFGQLQDADLSAEQLKRHLITLVTVDFYNHGTETTQMAEGTLAAYQTQFSFKNKVDDFYVMFLQKQTLKMDVYMSSNNRAKQLGRCHISLKELVQRERSINDSSSKTPVIEAWAKVYPLVAQQSRGGQQDIRTDSRPLGRIQFKMRLRKPITETVRFFREREASKNMAKALTLNQGSLRAPRRSITIQVLAAHKLNVAWAKAADIQPFFYYQFYTFDERYSHNSQGANPRFEDTMTYEVLFDAKAQSYFEREHLEVMFFDDNAPIGGINDGGLEHGEARGGADASNDMIGIARVPLGSLIQGNQMTENIQIMSAEPGQTGVPVGTLEIKISVMDMNTDVPSQSIAKVTNQLTYNVEWENHLIATIAQTLARINAETSLIFGIFSRGQRSVTKEDFKYCVLSRLNLKDKISEREMDFFLEGNRVLEGKSFIERSDFEAVFQNPLLRAKEEVRDEDSKALRNTFATSKNNVHGFTKADVFGAGGTLKKGGTMSKTEMMTSYNQSEVLDLIKEMVLRGVAYRCLTASQNQMRAGMIASPAFVNILFNEGTIGDQDGRKIAQSIDDRGNVDLKMFEKLIETAKEQASSTDESCKKLLKAIQNNGQLCCQRLESQDDNKDGAIKINGFHSAFLNNKINMTKAELSTAFNLICNRQAELYYYDWMGKQFPDFKQYFTRTLADNQSQAAIDTRRSDPLEVSQGLTRRFDEPAPVQVGPNMNFNDAHKLQGALSKIENYMAARDLSLGAVFQVMDTDSSKGIAFEEFKNKTRMLKMEMDDDEITALYKHIDTNGDNNVTYQEFVEKFQRINTIQLIKNINKIVIQSGNQPENLFNMNCSDRGGNMSKTDFKKLCRTVLNKTADYEMEMLFKHFDQSHKGTITKMEFLAAFESEVKEQGFQCNIEDIIKPLATKLRKFNKSVGKIFQENDSNNNGKLSADEIKQAMKNCVQMNLGDNEVSLMRQFFISKYRTPEINASQFETLLHTPFKRQFNDKTAKQSLNDLKNKFDQLSNQRVTPNSLMMEHNSEKTSMINLYNFKTAINTLKVLSQYNMDNLAKYLDKQNEGYIDIGDFSASVANSGALHNTMGSSRKY